MHGLSNLYGFLHFQVCVLVLGISREQAVTSTPHEHSEDFITCEEASVFIPLCGRYDWS
jgi:hypothetical protein